MSTGFHNKWRQGSVAERGAFSTSGIAIPTWWYETDTGYVWWWDSSAWEQIGSLPISAADVEVEEIGTAFYDDVQDWINNTQSAGRISGGTITSSTDAITGVTVGGAGAGEFEVAGDRTAVYLGGLAIEVRGSTANDGVYTVVVGGSTHAGGTTTIPVDEAVADGTVDGDIHNGRMNVAAGTGFIKVTDSDIGVSKFFDWDASSDLEPANNDVSYVFVDYNVGTEAITVATTTTRADIDGTTEFTMGRVYRDGGYLHIINSGTNVYNHAYWNHQRLVEVRGFERATGGVIAESGQRYLTATAGKFFLGANPITTAQQDTSGAERFTHWYNDGAWQDTTGQQQAGNTQYNDYGTGLAALTAADPYGVYWIFIHFDGDIHVIYGVDKYKLAEAENAVLPPNLPDAVSCFAVLAAKIIFERNENNFTSIVSAYETIFPVSSPANHNDLGGLQGGTTDEYYHLTSAEETALANMARGYILRGEAANIAAHDASTNHFVLVGDGTDIASKAFDWDDVGAGAGADMVHDHTAVAEGGPTLGSTADPLTLTVANVGLRVQDTGGDHNLIITPGEDLTAHRTLGLVTGDAARTIVLSGNPTLNDWFDQAVKQASGPTFADVFVPDGGTIGITGNELVVFHAVGVIEVQGATLGIGTATVPHGGIGGGVIAIEGAATSWVSGPHMQFTSATDNYPIMELVNYGHDAVGIAFDAYIDGAWKSSDVGSNFRIIKYDDKLHLEYDSGIAQGGAITWNESIILNVTGYVGINTSPGIRLDVFDDRAGAYAMRVWNDGNNVNRFGIYVWCGEDGPNGTGYGFIQHDGDGTEEGGVRCNAGTVEIWQGSDQSIKSDIEDLDIGLAELMRVKPRKFKKRGGPKKLHGFVAQELQEVCPRAVAPTPSGILGVARTALIPMMVRAIQELNAKMEAKQ